MENSWATSTPVARDTIHWKNESYLVANNIQQHLEFKVINSYLFK